MGGGVEKLRRNFVEADTLQIRAECSVKEQSWNIQCDSPGSVLLRNSRFEKFSFLGMLLLRKISGRLVPSRSLQFFFSHL